MTPTKQVFLSFAVDDGLNAQVLAALKRQAIAVWDFQTRAESVPAGSSIEQALREHIARADVFVILLTESAFESDWVMLELQLALARQKSEAGFAIIPIVDRSTLEAHRERPPMAQLRDILACYANVDSRLSIENAVARICEHLRVQYVPPPFEHPRIPFRDRIYLELRHCTSRAAYPSEAYQRVERLAIEFQELFDAGRHEEAQHVVSFLLATLRHEYRDEVVFYPVIVSAVNLLMLERHEEALEILSSLRSRLAEADVPAERFPRDCLPAAIGAVYYQMGDFAAARVEYRTAWGLAKKDAAIFMALLFSRIRCEEPQLDVNAELAKLPAPMFPGDERELAINAAFALGLNGDTKEALRRLEGLAHNGIGPSWPLALCGSRPASSSRSVRRRAAEVVAAYVDLLIEDGRIAECKELLESAIETLGDEPDLHLAAGDLCIRLSDRTKAQERFWKLAQCTLGIWRYQYAAMRGLVQAGARPKASIIAQRLLDVQSQGLPKKPSDFFITGAANWILGNEARALYDRVRSHLPDFSYRDYLGPCGGT